uniref:Uncharacterized protein n=1 Tax=Tanacetum cinerariifolium TaxID=118510 RepID=A0A699QBB6_TANCI|nr:hypothetical protein [Tanacetum cinerariifolium]
MKRKDGGAGSADRTTFVTSACGVGRILDHRNAMAFGQGIQGIEVKRGTGVMHRNDGLGARGDGALDQCSVCHQRVAVYIDEHGGRAQQADHVGGGDPGLRGRDDFIAWTDAQRKQGDVHGTRG